MYLPRGFVRSYKLFRRTSWFARILRESHLASLAGTNQQFGQILVSEENILGKSGDSLGSVLYPDATRKIAKILEIAPPHASTLYLSIRSQATILPSAFSQIFRGGRAPPPFEVCLETYRRDRPSWFELVSRIRASFPNVPLHVWRFEDYVADPLFFVRTFADCSCLARLPITIPESTRRLSDSAMEQLLNIGQESGNHFRREVAEILKCDAGGKPWDPLQPEDRALLERLYEEDVDRIRAEMPGVLIELA